MFLDAKKKRMLEYNLQDQPAIKTNGRVKNRFTSEKTADIQNGGHANSGSTNSNVVFNIRNGSGGRTVSCAHLKFSNNVDVVNMTAVEMTEVEGGMASEQDGVAEEKAENGIAYRVPASASVRKSSAEDSELGPEKKFSYDFVFTPPSSPSSSYFPVSLVMKLLLPKCPFFGCNCHE